MSRALRRILLIGPLLLGACASGAVKGPYVWASTLPAEAVGSVYQIKAGDDITVAIYGFAELGAKTKVRSDGMITLPLVGDVQAAGQTTQMLSAAIERALEAGKYVKAPRATVQVDEQVNVSVLGKVVRAGAYPLPTARGVADALAAAGGLTEFAHKDRIFVLRRVPTSQQIRFRFSSLFDPNDVASRFRLRGGDVVIVD